MRGGTVNTSGLWNRTPPLPYKPGANEALIDGFIADKWIDPELRWQEIVSLYQGQAKTLWRDHRALVVRLEKRAYAMQWIARILEYQEQPE